MSSVYSLLLNSANMIEILSQFSRNDQFLNLIENLNNQQNSKELLKEFIKNCLLKNLDDFAKDIFQNIELENVFQMTVLSKKDLTQRYLCKVALFCCDNFNNFLGIRFNLDNATIVEIVKNTTDLLNIDYNKINKSQDVYHELINKSSILLSNLFYPAIENIIDHNLLESDYRIYKNILFDIIKEFNKIFNYQSPFYETKTGSKRKRDDENKDNDPNKKK